MNRSRRYARVSLLALASGIGLALPAVGRAQTESSGPTQVGEVVVTGSRIAKRDYVSDSPIVTVDAKTLKALGPVEVDQELNYLPQFTPGGNEFATTLQSANTGESTLDLRGLGPARTLVLIDGRRLQPSGGDLVIDVNSIPSSLIQNVETITGGASAVYGADAVAGVVNFKLNPHFTGVEVSSQYGVTEHGDGQTYDVNVTVGGDFADHRGNAVIYFDYYRREAISTNQRSFDLPPDCADPATCSVSGAEAAGLGGSNFLPGGLYQPTLAGPVGPANSAPIFLAGGNFPSVAALTAVFGTPVNPTSNIGFNADGSLFTASNGIINYKGPGSSAGFFSSGGTLDYTTNVSQYSLLTTPLNRYNVFAHLNYDITPDVTLVGQVMFSDFHTLLSQDGEIAGFNVWNLIVPATNPFIPTDLATLLASRPQPTADFGLINLLTQFGPRVQDHDVVLYQVQLGLQGKVPNHDWTWEIYGSEGRTQTDLPFNTGVVSYSALEKLLFAPDGGVGTCAGGFNPFGNNPVSPQCLAFITSTAPASQTETQDIVEANLQGHLFNVPAGDLRFAVGADYRRNTFQFTNSPELNNNLPDVDLVTLSPSADTSGETDVKEVYGELLIPLLHNLPMVQDLSIDPAYRYSDYNTSGGNSTYKVDFNWLVVDQLRLRGGYERAVRAPNIGELFGGAVADPPFIGFTFQGLGDPCDILSSFRAPSNPNAAKVAALCVQQGVPAALINTFTFPVPQVGGEQVSNSSLTPEIADTFTLGAAWQPAKGSDVFGRLSMSVDYYHIDIKNAITYVPAQTALFNCFDELNSNPTFDPSNFYCKQITRSPGGEIVNLNTQVVNSGGIKTDGVDFQLDWIFDLKNVGLGPDSGSIALNFVGTYLHSFQIAELQGTPFLEFAGTLGGPASPLPKFRSNTTLAYSWGPATLGLRWNFLGSMASSTAVTTPNNVLPGVPNYSTFDLFARVSVTHDVELRGGIDNLFDKGPLVVNGEPGSTDPSVYDVLGRRFFVALTAKF